MSVYMVVETEIHRGSHSSAVPQSCLLHQVWARVLLFLITIWEFPKIRGPLIPTRKQGSCSAATHKKDPQFVGRPISSPYDSFQL